MGGRVFVDVGEGCGRILVVARGIGPGDDWKGKVKRMNPAKAQRRKEFRSETEF
jgi:hypothetical protein